MRFVVNGRPVARESEPGDRTPLAVKVGRRRKPSAVGYLVRHGDALPDDERVEATHVAEFVTVFLARWGESGGRRRRT